MPRIRTRAGGPGSAVSPEKIQGAHAGESAVFRSEGDYWTLSYRGTISRLKDSKGLAYIAWLLRYPGVEFHVLELVQSAGRSDSAQPVEPASGNVLPVRREELEQAGIHVDSLGDAGEMLDDQARTAYRRRMSELREEFEEAKQFNHLEQAERIEGEIQALAMELSRAVGLRGRSRRAASAAERARQSVTHAIKTALERIGDSHPVLCETLSPAIKTGIYCRYEPAPERPISWDLDAAPRENGNPENGRQSTGRAQPEVAAQFPVIGPAAIQSLPGQTGLVGRDAERLQLRAMVDRAAGGQGALVMMGGGPGVGKTRLATETAAYAASRGLRSFIGHCFEREEPYPFLPFAEIFETILAQSGRTEFRAALGDNAAELAQIAPRLRRIFSDIPPPPELPPQQVRRYLFQSLVEYIARIAGAAPLFLILDDLHWADESTLALVNFLAHRITQMPLLIVATYRDGVADTNPALERTLEELIRAGIRPLGLKGLTRDAVARMLRELSLREPPDSLVQLIFNETEGNPFFIEEVFKHLVEEGKIFDGAGDFRTDFEIEEIDVPANVRLVLGRRIQRLDPEYQRILTAAAVAGRNFSMNVLERLLEPENPEQLLSAIEQAQKMGLVGFSTKDPEAPFEFAHELIRQTLVATIAQPRRQRLHLNAAAAIEIAHAHEGGARAAEIAHHLIQAGPLSDPQRVKRYLVLAGRNALQAAAYEEARRHLSAAVAYHERGSRDYAELLLDLATAERGLGDWDHALVHWREAVDLFTAMGDCEATGNIFFEMFEGLLWSGRGNEAAETAQRGLQGLREECGSRVHLLASSGLINSLGGKYEPARKAFADALSMSSQLDDQKLASRVLAYRAVSDFYFLKLNDALDDGRRSASAGETAGAPWSRAIGLSRVQTALHHLGRNEEATAVARELEPLARKLGHFAALSFCIWTRAWAEFGKQPDFARLQKQLAEDLEINRTARIPLLLAPALAQFSVLEFLRGNQRAALDYAAEARALSPFHVMLGFGSGALFRQMAYAGDRIGALALLEESRGKLPRSGATNTIGSYAMLLAVVEGLYILGEHQKAAEFYPSTLQLMDTGAICFVWMARFPQTVAGIAAAAARNWTAAERHFDIAMRQAQAFPHQLEIAELRRLRAAMLIERGAADDAERARTLLTEALDVYSRIGMPRHVELARAMLTGMQTGGGGKASHNH